VFISQTKFEFPEMKNAKITDACATESASTCIIKRRKLMVKNMGECKQVESTLLDI